MTEPERDRELAAEAPASLARAEKAAERAITRAAERRATGLIVQNEGSTDADQCVKDRNRADENV